MEEQKESRGKAGGKQRESRGKAEGEGDPECSEGGGRAHPKESCWVLAAPLGVGEPLQSGLQELSNSQTIPPPSHNICSILFPVSMKCSFPHRFPIFPLSNGNNLSVNHQNLCATGHRIHQLYLWQRIPSHPSDLGLNCFLQARLGANKYRAYFMISKCTSCPGPKKTI